MSRARRAQRDAFKEPQGNAMPQQPREEEYIFNFQTPQGPRSFKVPARGMKCCPCGCSLFRSVFRVGYVKAAGIVGAEPICVKVEANVCDQCGREIGVADPTVGDLNATSNAGQTVDSADKVEETKLLLG